MKTKKWKYTNFFFKKQIVVTFSAFLSELTNTDLNKVIEQPDKGSNPVDSFNCTTVSTNDQKVRVHYNL